MASTALEPGRSKGRKTAKDLTDGEGSFSSNDKDFEGEEAPLRKRARREKANNGSNLIQDNGVDYIDQFDSSPGESTEDTDQDYMPNGAGKMSSNRVDSNGNQPFIHTVKMEPVGNSMKEPSKKANAAAGFLYRNNNRPRRGSGGGRHLSYSPDTDKRLLQWVMERDKNGLSVSREAIQSQALVLIRKECPDFKASSGWVEKFLNRHKLSLPNKATMLENGVAKNGMLPVPCDEFEQTNGHRQTSAPVMGEVRDDITSEEERKVESVPQDEAQEINLMSIPINRRGPTRKRIIRDFKQEEEDEDEDCEIDEAECEKVVPENVNPERLKAFNMFVRLFVDENLDRLVPISKQPKDKVLAIIHACQRQFPEFRDRARKRIRTYLKSCRRLKKLKEPLRRTADQINAAPSMSSAQMQEVNNILASACANEADLGDPIPSTTSTQTVATTQAPPGRPLATNGGVESPADTTRHISTSTVGSQRSQGTPPPTRTAVSPVQRLPIGGPESLAMARAKAGAEYKLNTTEVSAIRQLIASYRESAAFLYRSADELEALLPNATQPLGNQKTVH